MWPSFSRVDARDEDLDEWSTCGWKAIRRQHSEAIGIKAEDVELNCVTTAVLWFFGEQIGEAIIPRRTNEGSFQVSKRCLYGAKL